MKGSVLIISILMLLILTIAGLAILTSTGKTINIASLIRSKEISRAVAQVGTARFLNELRNNGNITEVINSMNKNVILDGKQYHFDIRIKRINTKNTVYVIETTGYGPENTTSRISIVLKKGGNFYPFAIKDIFHLEDFSSTGSGEIWKDATVAAKTIEAPQQEMTAKGFEFQQGNFQIPLVRNMALVDDMYNYYCNPPQNNAICKDNGDIKISNYPDKQIFITKDGNIIVDDSISSNKLLMVAGKTDSNSDTVGWIIIEENNQIELHGPSDTDGFYNLVLFAETGIKEDNPKSTTGIIHITGRQNMYSPSSVQILTPGSITIKKRKFIHDTGKTDNDMFILIWSDNGINAITNSAPFFHITGSSNNAFRFFSTIVGLGSAYMEEWKFTGSFKRAGLSCHNPYIDCSVPDDLCKQECAVAYFCNILTDYYASYPICNLLSQIKSGSGSVVSILGWKEE